jgi:biopolymer transport protein ExbB
MNARQIFSSLIAIAGLTFTQLQAQDIVRTNDELLQLVERGTATDDTEFQQRVDRFEQAQAEQDRLTAEANVEKRRQEDLSERLETAFEENELLIADRTEQLNTRLGSLRELFGVLQQVAGDARSLFENSITNIEYPDRAQFLTDLAAKMGSSSELASIAEIERLWFELQREATEQGKVKRISDFRFVTADGQEVFEDIVRVGTFNLVADGRYLSHNPDTNSVSELVRQPSQRRYTRSTADLLGAAPGDEVVRFGLDVTSGQLLALLLETPNLGERVQQGGIVGYVIISLGILGILLALERMIMLGLAGRKVKAQGPVVSLKSLGK